MRSKNKVGSKTSLLGIYRYRKTDRSYKKKQKSNVQASG
jgi:hypothetical protein